MAPLTAYGFVGVAADDKVRITGTRESIRRWSNRPGYSWPCSVLARLDSIVAELAPNGDLVDLHTHPHEFHEEIPGDELTAWVDSVILQAWREVATARPIPLAITESAYRRELASA